MECARSGGASPFHKGEGRVRDNFTPVETLRHQPLTLILSLLEGERRQNLVRF
jgi:hypothetical protein